MKKIGYILMVAAVVVLISGCDNRRPEEKRYDRAVERLTEESIKLGQAKEDQNLIQKYVPGMESDKVKYHRERVKAASHELETAAKNL
ncbi:MAG TPA: hypothetical protein PK178_11995 [Smithellaceae bacterium]|nr:hypothetical protein [Smithellaceae bacterium]